MTQTQKLEAKMNNLLKLINDHADQLTADDINTLNLTGFLYSVSRLNALQATARLVAVALAFMPLNDIVEAME